MSAKAKRELEFSGSGDPERVMREVFTRLSGGRAVPIEATRTEDIAYQDKTHEYRTAQGDGLVATECLDYGTYHHAWSYVLTVDEITVSVSELRQATITFYVSAPAAHVDVAIQTLIRIATASGFTQR